jgi:hypothetical protein
MYFAYVNMIELESNLVDIASSGCIGKNYKLKNLNEKGKLMNEGYSNQK